MPSDRTVNGYIKGIRATAQHKQTQQHLVVTVNLLNESYASFAHMLTFIVAVALALGGPIAKAARTGANASGRVACVY